jgi:hypothetical protein
VSARVDGALVNLPASMFLYPWSALFRPLLALRLRRLKQGMTAAARAGAVFHLWWHPHNFGINFDRNAAMLEEILRHYRYLAHRYGMESQCMGDFARRDSPAGAAPQPSLRAAPHAPASMRCTGRAR